MKFDELPNDIKIKILSINEENNFKKHQQKFNIVLDELLSIQDELILYYDIDSMNPNDINSSGISYFMLQYLDEINIFNIDEDY
tara:strand:+ start:562 stop:813 length:252 start_codon:yes stop_codon:yes gene_type:complete